MNEASSTSIKRFSFELGGNNPAIILEDAPLPEVVKHTMMCKTGNAGQVCVAFNRVYCHESLYDQYCDMVAQGFSKVQLGTGFKFMGMGPLINHAARDRMLDLIKDAVDKGAKLLVGGQIPDDPALAKGAFITPAVLKDCTDDMRVVKEEIFGPVLPILKYSDIDDAIERANNTELGLTTYIFGRDPVKLLKCFELIQSGEILINGSFDIGGGPHLPHVGVKQSGIGCDNSKYALESYYVMRRAAVKIDPNTMIPPPGK